MSGFTTESELLNAEIARNVRGAFEYEKTEEEYTPPSKRPWWALSSQREIEEEKEINENETE